MTGWYPFSIIALLLLGTQRFLYKVAAEKHCSAALTTTVFMGTVTLLSAAVFFATGATAVHPGTLLLLALVNSCSFAGATIAHIEALKHLPAGITFPLTRLSLVLVILVSIVVLGERLAPLQWLGVLVGLAVFAILAHEANRVSRSQSNPRVGFFFIALCIFCGAVASISSKLAAESVSKAGFIALSYLFGSFFSLGIEFKWGRKTPGRGVKPAILLGAVMGVLNFFGFYAFLTALARGPLAAIALITGVHFVIAIVLSVAIYHEKITFQRSLGIGLTLVALFLLRQ